MLKTKVVKMIDETFNQAKIEIERSLGELVREEMVYFFALLTPSTFIRVNDSLAPSEE